MLTDNDTIDLEESQEMSAEEAKASLGVANMLMEQIMPQQEMTEGGEGDQTQESAPEGQKPQEPEQSPAIDPEALKSEILGDVQKTVQEAVKMEMEEFKKVIQEALTDDTETE